MRGPSRVISARRRFLVTRRAAEAAADRLAAAQAKEAAARAALAPAAERLAAAQAREATAKAVFAEAETAYRSLMDKRAGRDARQTMEALDG